MEKSRFCVKPLWKGKIFTLGVAVFVMVSWLWGEATSVFAGEYVPGETYTVNEYNDNLSLEVKGSGKKLVTFKVRCNDYAVLWEKPPGGTYKSVKTFYKTVTTALQEGENELTLVFKCVGKTEDELFEEFMED